MRTVRTSKELVEALEGKEEYVYVEGGLKNKILRMKFVSKVLWVMAGGICLAGGVEEYVAIVAIDVATIVSIYSINLFLRNGYDVVRLEAGGLVLRKK